jgi:hypothetical protein
MKLILRFAKLFGVATVVFAGILSLIFGAQFASKAYKDWRTNGFTEKYGHLKAQESTFYKIATRVKADDSLSEDRLNSILQSPKLIAITIQPNSHSGTITRVSGEVDPLMESMEADWIPRSSEEVNLIVGTTYRHEIVGTFSDGKRAFQEVCHFSICDLQTGQKLLEGTAAGSEPRGRKKHYEGDQYGGPADSKVVELIKQGLNELREKIAASPK